MVLEEGTFFYEQDTPVTLRWVQARNLSFLPPYVRARNLLSLFQALSLSISPVNHKPNDTGSILLLRGARRRAP